MSRSLISQRHPVIEIPLSGPALIGSSLAVPQPHARSVCGGSPAAAQVQPYPANFRTQEIQTNSTTLHVRVGGQGPAIVLLHGYGEIGDMWAPLAAELARDHTVVAPDLRGMGLSSRPENGYDRRRKPETSPGCSMRSASTKPIWLPTTSATWSAMPSRRSIRRGSRALSSWMRRCQASALAGASDRT